jgi:hypothetical protein
MACHVSVRERAQIAARYEVWNSIVLVQRWWHTVKGRNATIHLETIKNCHSKLMTTGLVKDARRSVHPHPGLRRMWQLSRKCSLAAQVNQHVRLLVKVGS